MTTGEASKTESAHERRNDDGHRVDVCASEERQRTLPDNLIDERSKAAQKNRSRTRTPPAQVVSSARERHSQSRIHPHYAFTPAAGSSSQRALDGVLVTSVLDSKFGDRYSWRGARIARREEGVYWA